MTARHGFSLTEVLVGLTIAVLASVPILTLYQGEERESALTVRHLLVANRLRELVDRTRSECIRDHFRHRAYERASLPVGIGAGCGLRIAERVQVMPALRTAGLYLVRAEAKFSDPTGGLPGEREMVLEQLVADPEWGACHRPERRLP